MEPSTTEQPAATQRIALRRWSGLIAAQIAYFEHLVAAHQEEVGCGLLP
jgi:hypothetical protein